MCVCVCVYIYILGINLIDNPSFFIIGDFICFEKLDLNDKFYCDLVVLFENTWRISSIKVYYLFSFVYILKSENIM